MNISQHDLFCAAALQGLLAGRNVQAKAYDTAEVARVAIECADQMMMALSAPKAESQPATPDSAPLSPTNVVDFKR